MHTAKMMLFGVALFVAGLLLGNLEISTGTAQEAHPTEHKGIGITKLDVVPEESMIKQTGLEGYFLQLRLATLEPGGQIARHDHATRPGLVYTLEGSWVEGWPGGEREYPAGEEIALVEAAETDHWFYNRNEKPVKVLICDLGHAKLGFVHSRTVPRIGSQSNPRARSSVAKSGFPNPRSDRFCFTSHSFRQIREALVVGALEEQLHDR